MMTRQKLWLIILLLGGCVALTYGSLFHVIAVESEKERQISIAVPTLLGFDQPLPDRAEHSPAHRPQNEESPSDDVDPFRTSPSADRPPSDSENPFDVPASLPSPAGMKFEKVTEKYFETSEELERGIVRDVTIGGVTRLANGALKRTYSGKAPSLCPT
jgi:hypothetical protein